MTLVIPCCKCSTKNLLQKAELTFRRPYVAQGAAQAIEDAAALGIILSNITSKEQVHRALEIYQQCRKERADTIQAFGHGQRESLHLHDGPDQIARDLAFATPSTGGGQQKKDRWVDDETRKYMWIYDVEKEAQKAYDQGILYSIALYDSTADI